MKIKNLLLAFAASALAIFACTKENTGGLDNIKLSQTYISIPTAGGTATFTIEATEPWEFLKDVVINDSTAAYLPSWITTQSALKGDAGKYDVKFTAAAIDGGREQELHIKCGEKIQYIRVRQGSLDAVKGTCAEVIEAADGKSFEVTGTCTAIANTYYGNFYINDGTGELYIYGLKNSAGSYDWSSFNIEVGDVVTVQGSKTTYGTTVEFVDATFINCSKSLLKLDTDEITFTKDASTDTIKVSYKGDALTVNMPEVWEDSTSVEGGVYFIKNVIVPGVPSKTETNPADTALVVFGINANEGKARTCTINFSTSSNGSTSTASVKIIQKSGLSTEPLPFSENFSSGIGGFIINDIVPLESGKAIWSAGKYFSTSYMVASPGSAVDTKSMLISPRISLIDAESPVLSFTHAGKYCGDQAEELTVWISSDGCETWTQLLIPTPHDNNYTFVNSGDISLASFAGVDYVNIAFQYISNTKYYGKWEVTDVKVEDRPVVINTIAGLTNCATSQKTNYTVNLTNAVVTYVNGSSAYIEDVTGGIQFYQSSGNITALAAGDVINGEVNVDIQLYNGEPEAYSFDVSAGAKVAGEAPEPTVLTLDKVKKDFLRYQSCFVKLENVTFDSPMTGGKSGRDGVISQDGVTMNVRAQVKTLTEMSGTGNLLCFPAMYNTTQQLSVWTNDHFTPAD